MMIGAASLIAARPRKARKASDTQNLGMMWPTPNGNTRRMELVRIVL
jgi:hypothetical protein